MSDELEERRLMRLLDRAAADVPELDRGEIRTLLARARGHRRHQPHRFRAAARRVRVLAPAATAAVIAAAVLVGSTAPGSAGPDERPPTPASVLVFPEASALELLLADRRTRAA